MAEVVPVSSSAQLSLWPWLLRWQPPADRTAFAAGMHAGSCVGLAVALRPDLAQLDRRTAGGLLLSGLPAAFVGAVTHHAVERRLGTPRVTSALLAAGGVALLVADRSRGQRFPRATDLAVAGAAQVVALAPGVSRAGATLTALRGRGVGRAQAVRTSQLMSLPITGGAAALTMLRSGTGPPLVPSVLAGVAAWTVARRLDPASRSVLVGASLYRVGLAAAVAARLRREHR